MVDMTPTPDDVAIHLPITFDYHGGRNENKKGKIIAGILIGVITLIITIGVLFYQDIELWQRFLISCVAFYIGLFIMRFFIFSELRYSDMYETLKERDYKLETPYIWKIFDIEPDYPYTVYFQNGQKGIFVRMEKDAITGKADHALYDHYQAIGNAYNRAHTLNMNVTHIDYMENVGNDARLTKMYNDLADVTNPDMQELLIAIYDNLAAEMSMCYSSFDIYLFLTRDKKSNFIYNVQQVCGTMLGGNYITYKILSPREISGVCKAIFNLEDFSYVQAMENLLQEKHHRGIIPISITYADGSEEILNKTQEEIRIENQERQRKMQELKQEQERNKRIKKKEKKTGIVYNPLDNLDNEEVDLFGEDDTTFVNEFENDNNLNNQDDLDLFENDVIEDTNNATNQDDLNLFEDSNIENNLDTSNTTLEDDDFNLFED